MAKSAPWDFLIGALEKWRGGMDAPSVTTVAARYHNDPWATLLSTIVSLRTKDAVTLAASERLLAEAPTPAQFLALPAAEAEKLLYPAGFYRTKVKNLRAIAEILIEKYGGDVPQTLEELLALPGVGRKTANLVLIEAFDKEGLCVDTHVHRISNRLGVVATKNPDDTEMALREILPKKYWKNLNALLVLYGQRVCVPVSPHCSACALKKWCARVGVTKSR